MKSKKVPRKKKPQIFKQTVEYNIDMWSRLAADYMHSPFQIYRLHAYLYFDAAVQTALVQQGKIS